MAKIHPFRGYRYDPDKSGSLEKLVTQPYDKISDELLSDYQVRSPYNIAHVIRNPDYGEAGAIFHRWIEQGILRQDPLPALYPYEQSFRYERQEYSRLGFIGLVGLQDSDVAVRGHERVLQKPFEDRLNLIRQTESNDGLIFSLFSDPTHTVDAILSRITAQTLPSIAVEDDFGVMNRIWLLSDKLLQGQIMAALQEKTLYIADGHHRFETAKRYCSECLEKGWRPLTPESFDKRMMALFNMETPGLKILPTHRAIRNLADLDRERLLKRLTVWFQVHPLESLSELDAMMNQGGHRFGMITREPFQIFGLTLRESAPDFMPHVQGPARELDVNILHQGILEPLLGIGTVELEKESHVDYHRDRQTMVELLIEGKYQLTFLLNPTRLEQVREISELGQRMPQKSTDFYPKLLTGLVFMKMQIGKQL